MNLFVRAFPISVVECVDYSLAYAHANAVAHLFVETSRFGHAQAHFLRQIYALDLRVQYDFQVLVFWRHARVSHRANRVNLGLCMGNTMGFPSSMEWLA